MAVYTPVDAAALTAFLTKYDVGTAVSFKGIAEGVENSNYLLETTRGRYILTLYEKRVEPGDLPWFLSVMAHCANGGLPVPRPIPDLTGTTLQQLCGRPACLIEFVAGVSVTDPAPADARAAGDALGLLHATLSDFAAERPNGLGPEGWGRLAAACAGQLDGIAPGLDALVSRELAAVAAAWPHHLARATIHADLFPDNVLLLDGRVTGVIDFYFACTDIRAYDLAVAHSAWVFPHGRFDRDLSAALIAGYRAAYMLTGDEIAALPILCRGAALRFLLTRAYDWLNTPKDALVTRKDPLAFARRLEWYAAAGPDQILGH